MDVATPRQVPIVVVERYWPSVTVDRYLAATAAAPGSDGLASIVLTGDDRVLTLVVGRTAAEAEAIDRARGMPFIRISTATLLLSAGRTLAIDHTEEVSS